MKLYLSSYHLSNSPEKFSSLFGDGQKIAIIPNALDFSTDYERLEEGLKRESEDLSNLGLNPEIMDLKEYFGSPEKLRLAFQKVNGVWVIGGNVFVLRRALEYSGFREIVNEFSNEFVYGGYSAGVCVLGPILKGLELVDDPNIIPDEYEDEVIWDGLGVIDYCIAPHYASNHEESNDVEKVVKYYLDHKILFKVLRDGEEIVKER
jgi:dipeptidase E